MSKRRTYDEIRSEILEYLRLNGYTSTREICESMGYDVKTSGFRKCLNDLIREGMVEYLYPETPRTCKQKVCLSRKAVGISSSEQDERSSRNR